MGLIDDFANFQKRRLIIQRRNITSLLFYESVPWFESYILRSVRLLGDMSVECCVHRSALIHLPASLWAVSSWRELLDFNRTLVCLHHIWIHYVFDWVTSVRHSKSSVCLILNQNPVNLHFFTSFLHNHINFLRICSLTTEILKPRDLY